MIRKLSLLFVFLAGTSAALFAQSTYTLNNGSASGGCCTYDGGIHAYLALSQKGYINFYTGPIASILPSGGSFSNNGAWFNYSTPNNGHTASASAGSGTTENVSGTLVLQSTSTSGSSTIYSYVLTMTFSGIDIYSRAFSGTSTQLIQVKVSAKGATVSDGGGTTAITVY